MDARETLKTLDRPMHDVRAQIPDTWAGFREMHDAALADGALSAMTKEMIALAISVVEGCDGCVASHVRWVALHGATQEEVAEAIGVALLMRGARPRRGVPGHCRPTGTSPVSRRRTPRWSRPATDTRTIASAAVGRPAPASP